MEVKLTKDELDTLYMCRNKAIEVRQLEKRVSAFLPTASGLYSSPKMTGMPGARDPHGLDGSARKNEAQFQALEFARDELEALRIAAHRIICKLDWKMHDFCIAFFVNGLEMPGEVAASIGKDESTCWRKLRKFREGGDFRRKMQRNASECNEMPDFAKCQGMI